MHAWSQRGTKIWGVLRGVMVSVAGVTMGRVYPEKEAGPLGPAGVRMSGRRGPPAEEAEEGSQARAGFAGGGRGLQEEGGVCRRRAGSTVPPGAEGSGHVRTEKGQAGAGSVAWRGQEPGWALVLVGQVRGHTRCLGAENEDSPGRSAEGCSQHGKHTCMSVCRKKRARRRNGRFGSEGRQAGAAPGVGGGAAWQGVCSNRQADAGGEWWMPSGGICRSSLRVASPSSVEKKRGHQL